MCFFIYCAIIIKGDFMHEVLDFDHQGRGIIKIDNKIVFVDNAIKGEIIEIET